MTGYRKMNDDVNYFHFILKTIIFLYKTWVGEDRNSISLSWLIRKIGMKPQNPKSLRKVLFLSILRSSILLRSFRSLKRFILSAY